MSVLTLGRLEVNSESTFRHAINAPLNPTGAGRTQAPGSGEEAEGSLLTLTPFFAPKPTRAPPPARGEGAGRGCGLGAGAEEEELGADLHRRPSPPPAGLARGPWAGRGAALAQSRAHGTGVVHAGFTTRLLCWVRHHRAALGGWGGPTAQATRREFCSLINGLSRQSRLDLPRGLRRVHDIGLELAM